MAAMPETRGEEPPRRKRGRPRQGPAIARHLPRDEEILKIAAEVFYARGFEGARLEEIASKAGIVKGSLYHYFESKEQIYERLVEDIVQLCDDIDDPTQRGLTPDERLEGMVRRRVLAVAKHPVQIGILGRQLVHMDGEIGEWSRQFRRRNHDAMRDVIVQGQKAGIFRPADPDALAAFIVGSITVLAEWYRPDGRLPIDRIVEEMTHFVMAGVRGNARPRPAAKSRARQTTTSNKPPGTRRTRART